MFMSSLCASWQASFCQHFIAAGFKVHFPTSFNTTFTRPHSSNLKMKADKALECFVGAWGFINATLTNTTSGAALPQWHSVYPSGISTYTSTGYTNFIITANDTTEPEKRPKELSLPAKASDPDSRWALVGKYSLAAGGPFHLTNITGNCGPDGPAGVLNASFTTATLPSWVGFTLPSQFEFFDNCNLHVLKTYYTPEIVQTVYFGRKPPVA